MAPLLVGIGIGLMIYGIAVCIDLIRAIRRPTDRTAWHLTLVLATSFLFGYIVYLGWLLVPDMVHGPREFIVSAVFCGGAGFVVVVFRTGRTLVRALEENAASLENANRMLIDHARALAEARDAITKKSAELAKTLEDFYTVRITMAAASDDPLLAAENKRIKDRLDALTERDGKTV